MVDIKQKIRNKKWDAIKLTNTIYRGAVKEYKTKRGVIPLMFYLDEAFIVEDEKGLFTTEDLKLGLMRKKYIDLEATGCIKGLRLVAYIENKDVVFVVDALEQLDLGRSRRDIGERLKMLNLLSELVVTNFDMKMYGAI